MKRILDVLVSFVGLVIAGPFLLVIMYLVWRQDHRSPFYIAPRLGKGGLPFRMVKMRSMVANADKSGVVSTASTDRRITPVGQFIRRYKVDEITQLWNVLRGDMSLVGPRPQVEQDAQLYTSEERRLLSVRPGITDFASIVFADEGAILAGTDDPDLVYNQLIRPWKSRLGLFYIDHANVLIDVRIVWLTVLSIMSRRSALRRVRQLLADLGAPPQLVVVAGRTEALTPYPPPGASRVFSGRGEEALA